MEKKMETVMETEWSKLNANQEKVAVAEIPPAEVEPKCGNDGPYNNGISDLHFRIPIDKIWIRSDDEIDTSWLDSRKIAHHIRPKDGYHYVCEVKLQNSANIVIYVGLKGTEVQINPNQWNSYSGMSGFLERLFGEKYSSTRISKFHFDVIVNQTIEDVTFGIRAKRKSFSKNFIENTVRKSGHIDRVELMSTIGSVIREQIGIYDAAKRHGLKAPATKIEIRDNDPAVIPVKQVQDIPGLLKSKPISRRIELLSLVKMPNLKKKHERKCEIFLAMADAVGISIAISYFRNRPGTGKNFDRDFKAIFRLEPFPIDLDALFHADLNAFVNQPMSEFEQELITVPHIGEIPEYLPRKPGRLAFNPASRIKTSRSEQRKHYDALCTNLTELARHIGQEIYAETRARCNGIPATAEDFDFIRTAREMVGRKIQRLIPLLHMQRALIQLAKAELWDIARIEDGLYDPDDDYFVTSEYSEE